MKNERPGPRGIHRRQVIDHPGDQAAQHRRPPRHQRAGLRLQAQRLGENPPLDLAVAQVLVDRVGSDRGRPGVQRTFPPVPVDGEDDLHHRLLREVGLIAVPWSQQAADRPLDDRRGTVVQGRCRPGVTGLQCRQQLAVVHRPRPGRRRWRGRVRRHQAKVGLSGGHLRSEYRDQTAIRPAQRHAVRNASGTPPLAQRVSRPVRPPAGRERRRA